jgi:hypothetical protein
LALLRLPGLFVDVRFGSLADIVAALLNVRSTSESGHHRRQSPRPLSAKSRHPLPHSITSSAVICSVSGTLMPSAAELSDGGLHHGGIQCVGNDCVRANFLQSESGIGRSRNCAYLTPVRSQSTKQRPADRPGDQNSHRAFFSAVLRRLEGHACSAAVLILLRCARLSRRPSASSAGRAARAQA